MNESKGKALNLYIKLIGDGIFTDVDYYHNSYDDILTILVDLNKEIFTNLDKIKEEKFLKRSVEIALKERFKEDIDLFFRSVINTWVRRIEFEIINL